MNDLFDEAIAPSRLNAEKTDERQVSDDTDHNWVDEASLAAQTMFQLRQAFAERQHAPSAQMWTSLRAVAAIMEGMANGTCEPKIYVSSLDPGVGKTTTVIAFLQTMLASPRHSDTAALVCVQRRSQIASIVAEAGLSTADFAVLTADKDLNALGSGDPKSARVLFTTHSMIESRCSWTNFQSAECFFYRGSPREVRVWDEAILPGQTLTISRDCLALLLAPLRGALPRLADEIEELLTKLKSAETGTAVELPDFVERYGIDQNQVIALVKGNKDQVLAVETLWFLSGKRVTVRRDGSYGNTLLDYRDTLPEDIKPLLALNASARVRTVYAAWESHRGGIEMLPQAPKDYSNLTISVWNRGGGKSSFRRESSVLIEGIVATIEKVPDDEWLVVHHRSDSIGVDFEAEVRRKSPLGSRVHFLSWGAHDAINDFAHVPNIILAGTLFFRPSYYEALGRLAAARPSGSTSFSDMELEDMMAGENRHLILQGLCRGAVRKSLGDGCPPTRAFIIASAKSGIGRQLPLIFPGAQVVSWSPIQRKLKGKVGDAVAFITTQIASDPNSYVSARQVMDHVGWKDAKEFKRSIRNHQDFQEALAACDVVETSRSNRPVYCRTAIAYGFDAHDDAGR